MLRKNAVFGDCGWLPENGLILKIIAIIFCLIADIESDFDGFDGVSVPEGEFFVLAHQRHEFFVELLVLLHELFIITILTIYIYKRLNYNIPYLTKNVYNPVQTLWKYNKFYFKSQFLFCI